MQENLTGLVNAFVDPEKILKHIIELSEDPSMAKNLIHKQMMILIKEIHPKDYKDFIERNRTKLEEIERKFETKYSLEIKHKVSGLFRGYE